MDSGKVLEVSIIPTGSTSTALHAIGATVISVVSAGDFAEDGGQVMLGSLVYTYLSANHATNTITLASALTVAVEADDRVLIYPLSEDKWAIVDTPAYEDSLRCRIPHQLAAMFIDGVRDVFNQESVWIEVDQQRGGWVIRDVNAQTPSVLGTYVSTADGPVGGDSLPPAYAPTVHAISGLRTILGRLEPIANNDPVNYEWHLTTVNTPPTPADPLTEVHYGPEASYTVRKLPDGATDLSPDTTYYLWAVAHDDDGYGPMSTSATAQALQVTGPDIAANTVTGDNIVGNTITADKFAAVLALVSRLDVGANITINPTDGFKIELTNGGEIRFPPDGTDAILRGVKLTADEATVEKFTINGDDNSFAGKVTLGSGVLDPKTAPDVVTTWADPATYVLTDTVLPDAGGQYSGARYHGLFWDAPNNQWLATRDKYNDGYASGVDTPASMEVVSITPAGVPTVLFVIPRPTPTTWWNPHSICKIGTDIFLSGVEGAYLGYPGPWMIRRYSTAGTLLGENLHNNVTTQRGVCLATDGTSLFTGYFDDGNYTLTVTKHTPSSTPGVACSAWTQYGTWPQPGPTLAPEMPTGFYVGSADFGANRYVFQLDPNNGVIGPTGLAGVFSGTLGAAGGALTRQTSQEWLTNGSGQYQVGMTWDGTRFWGLDYNWRPKLWKYSTVISVVSRAFAYTYEDPTPPYTTLISPTKSFSTPLRQWTKITASQPAPTTGATVPTQYGFFAAGWKQGAVAVPGTSLALGTFLTSGTPSPGANNFPLTDFGSLVSTAEDVDGPLIDLRGDAAWRLDPISNLGGVFVDTRDEETLWTPTWRNGAGGILLAIGNGTIIGRYWVYGKRVIFEINMTRGSTTNVGTTTYVFGFPPGLPIDTASLYIHPMNAAVYDSSAGTMYPCVAWRQSTTEFYISAPNGQALSNAGFNGIAWAVNDQTSVYGSYLTP